MFFSYTKMLCWKSFEKIRAPYEGVLSQGGIGPVLDILKHRTGSFGVRYVKLKPDQFVVGLG